MIVGEPIGRYGRDGVIDVSIADEVFAVDGALVVDVVVDLGKAVIRTAHVVGRNRVTRYVAVVLEQAGRRAGDARPAKCRNCGASRQRRC